jgi:hypothetical protein
VRHSSRLQVCIRATTDLSDTDAVLGVQWLYSLGEIGFNYQTLTMSFIDARSVVLHVYRGASGSIGKEDGGDFSSW